MRFLTILAMVSALAAPVSAQAQTATLSIGLARTGADLHEGQLYGEIQSGLLCTKDRDLRWTEKNNKVDAPSFAGLFNEAISAAGLRAPARKRDLFDSKEENLDLQVGAMITGLNLRTCAMGSNEVRTYGTGDVAMSVEWQIYSVAQSKVIARIATTATVKSKLGAMNDDYVANMIDRAFTANAAQLAAGSELAALLRTPNPAVAPTQVPPASILMNLASASRPTPFDLAVKGVVSIFTADALGSGFLISAEGYMLTNHHVAGDVGNVKLRWADGSESVGEVIRADRKRDVALIKTIPPKSATVLTIRRTPVQLAESVYAVGTPREKEFSGTLTRGVVSTTSRVIEGATYIQSDVAVTHGNSGGPLLDEKGAVVGIAQSVYEPDGVGQNINFFVPIEEALTALGIKPAN